MRTVTLNLAERLQLIQAAPAARVLAAMASPGRTVAMMRVTWLARRTGLRAAARAFGGPLRTFARIAPDPAWTPWSRTVPGMIPAAAPRRGAVTLLPGCVMDQGFGPVHAAAASLLSASGFDVNVPRGPLCCGALHAHVGDAATASDLLAKLAAALPESDALIVDAAGCGSHLKEARGPMERWRGRTFDVLEWLDAHGLRAAPRASAPPIRVAYQDPCHLRHGQRVIDAPRRLLRAAPGVELVELGEPDRCCGSAGVYNVSQPELAAIQLARKVELVRAAAPDVLATANPGCALQLAAGLRDAGLDIPVRHVVEVLAAANACPPPGAGAASVR
ncbi:MAG: Lactate utilization protein A [Planctomycetes bacterium]|nr:Lactate utilization protein A [Planctomycetota bacterium]